MDKRKVRILRNALGIGESGKRPELHNHFVPGRGSDDYADCMALVEEGLMIRRTGNELSGGEDTFLVTDAGRDAARPWRKPSANLMVGRQ